MASPQLENGYARVANEIMEALAVTPLSGIEIRIILVVMRETYGRPKSPKSAALSLGYLAKQTQASRSRVGEVVSRLIAR